MGNPSTFLYVQQIRYLWIQTCFWKHLWAGNCMKISCTEAHQRAKNLQMLSSSRSKDVRKAWIHHFSYCRPYTNIRCWSTVTYPKAWRLVWSLVFLHVDLYTCTVLYIYFLFIYTTYISTIPGSVHPHLWLNVMFLSSENVRIAKPEPLKPSRYVIDCPFANFVRRCVECVVEGSLGCIYNLFLLMYCVSIRCICKNLQIIQMYMYVYSELNWPPPKMVQEGNLSKWPQLTT